MEFLKFIHQLSYEDIPKDVVHQAKRCLLDTIGSAMGGRDTDISKIIYDFTAEFYQGNDCRLWWDGRKVSAAGAALAHAIMIDGLDIHDNFNPAKGHAGVALVPVLLATLAKSDIETSGKELITALVIGYEIALRAGLSLHATACDYHTSGAWNALGCAAIVAKIFKLNNVQTRHALGIAEYYGPRSQMMRCIDHPTMLKDGSGWGALAGISAGFLAKNGFTGAPAITIEEDKVSEFWNNLGEKWHILDQDFKKYAVCHWAQPAIAGMLELIEKYNLSDKDIAKIQVNTFEEATHLNCRRPQTTEEAQYNLLFSVAAATVFGQLGPKELSGKTLTDKVILNCVDKIEMCEDEKCNKFFPGIQTAWVKIITNTGNEYKTDLVEAPWDVTNIPATDDELIKKYFWLSEYATSIEKAGKIKDAVWGIEKIENCKYLNELFDQMCLA